MIRARVSDHAPLPAKMSRRQRLFLRDRVCFWCGCETVWEKKKATPPANFATVDHVYDRLHPARQNGNGKHERTVLACYACNHRRSLDKKFRQETLNRWHMGGASA